MTSSTPNALDQQLNISAGRRRAALQAVMAEVRAVLPSALATINMDIPTAVTTVLGCLPELQAFRSRIAALPEFDIAKFDKLETYALATAHAHTEYVAASQPPEPIQELYDTLIPIRETLISDATALTKRKLIDGEPLASLRGPVGFKNMAFDVLLLCTMFRNHWAAIEGNSAVKKVEVDAAEDLADRLDTAIGLKEQSAAKATEANETRQRAFTIFVNGFDQARRAMWFLRWSENDADTIAPSLYAGRGRRKQTEPEPTTAVAPAPSPAQPASAPTTPATPANGVGMPGDSPFAHG